MMYTFATILAAGVLTVKRSLLHAQQLLEIMNSVV